MRMGGLLERAGEAVRSAGEAVGILAERPREVIDGEKFYKAGLEAQKPYHGRWFRAIAYFLGKHYLDWGGSSGWFTAAPAPSWRERAVTNLTKPKVRTAVGKLMRSKPSWAAMPGADDEQSRSGARIATRLLENLYYEDAVTRKLISWATWAAVCSTSFLWTLWDAQAGPRMEVDQVDPTTGEPVKSAIALGEVDHQVSGPFETILDPEGGEDFNDHVRVMRARVRSLDYIKNRWGKDVPKEQISPEAALGARIRTLAAAASDAALSSTETKFENHAIVKEAFELPSREFPEGRMWVYANGVVLSPAGPLDYFKTDHERALPVSPYGHVAVPGSVWAASVTDDVIPLNEVHNRLTSSILQTFKLQGHAKVLAPVGSLKQEQWTDQEGEVVEYVPVGGLKPEAYTPPEVPVYILNLRDGLLDLIDRVSSIQSASEGRLPRRATSGKAIDILQSADDTVSDPSVMAFASALERAGNITLQTMKRKYAESRTVSIVGKGHEVEVLQFTGKTIQGAARVRVIIRPKLSPADKVDLAVQMAELGVIPKEDILEVVELADINLVFDKNADQGNYAMQENLGMAKGVQFPVGRHEPHEVHRRKHRDFLNSDLGTSLPKEARMLIEAHIAEHDAYEAMVVQEKMALAGPMGGMPAPGMPPEPAGAPPPGAPI